MAFIYSSSLRDLRGAAEVEASAEGAGPTPEGSTDLNYDCNYVLAVLVS